MREKDKKRESSDQGHEAAAVYDALFPFMRQTTDGHTKVQVVNRINFATYVPVDVTLSGTNAQQQKELYQRVSRFIVSRSKRISLYVTNPENPNDIWKVKLRRK